MSRHILRLGFILVAVSLMIGGCGRKNDLPDDPLEALAAITQNAKGIKSAHFTGSVIGIIESEGKTENAGMIIDGDEVWADKEHLFLRRQIIRVETLADNLPESEADTLKIQAQMDWQYSKINEPIEIKAPQN